MSIYYIVKREPEPVLNQHGNVRFYLLYFHHGFKRQSHQNLQSRDKNATHVLQHARAGR